MKDAISYKELRWALATSRAKPKRFTKHRTTKLLRASERHHILSQLS